MIYSFFDQFAPDQVKDQLSANIEQLKRMRLKAITTGKKVNGYTPEQLNKSIESMQITLNLL